MSLSRSELKPWAREHLRGVQNCLFPSFTADMSALDEEGIRWDVQQSIRHGFFATCCTTEAGLSFEEALRFVSIVAEEAAGKLLVSAVAMFDTIEQNIAFLQAVATRGADMALVGYPPGWRPADADEVLRATRRMCEASDLPVVVYPSHKYSFGRFHPAGFPVELLERLVEIDSVAAVELALLEPGFIYETFRRVGDVVPVNCPWERWVPLLVGTYGQQWMGPGAYELFQSPEQRNLVEYFAQLQRGEVDRAMETYWRLTPARMTFERQFMPTQAIGTYHWPQQKYYQWLVGGNGGYTRQPVMRLYQHDMDDARNAVRALGIEPAENDEEFFVGRAAYARARR